MRATVRIPSSSRFATPTATYKVMFGKRNGVTSGNGNGKESPSARIPHVTRLLAHAHRIEGMIRAGELKDWAEASRLIGVTRARMTQITNLLLLAPEIQETVLSLASTVQGQDRLTECTLRPIVRNPDWRDQKRIGHNLFTLDGPFR